MQTARRRSTNGMGKGFGNVLRHWRCVRGLSQLDLALESDVSQRHISFLESGRAQPSRDMILRLATVLDVPLREQNVLLVAAGFAPMYMERQLDGPDVQQIRKAINHILFQQEPYPAVVIDRQWNLLLANKATHRLLEWILHPHGMPSHLAPDGRINLLRLLFHPDGFRPFVRNWPEVAGWLIERVHREAVAEGQNDASSRLLKEVLSYPDVPRAWHVPHWEARQDPTLTIQLSKNDLELQFFTTITTLGTPYDITVQELHIECFFPADGDTERNIEKLGMVSR